MALGKFHGVISPTTPIGLRKDHICTRHLSLPAASFLLRASSPPRCSRSGCREFPPRDTKSLHATERACLTTPEARLPLPPLPFRYPPACRQQTARPAHCCRPDCDSRTWVPRPTHRLC